MNIQLFGKIYSLVLLAFVITACSTSRTIDLGDVETKRLITPDEIFDKELKSPEVSNVTYENRPNIAKKLKPINESVSNEPTIIDLEDDIVVDKIINNAKSDDFNQLAVEKEITVSDVDSDVLYEVVEAKDVVPAQYITLLSERLLNKMLNEADLTNKNLYIMEVKTLAKNLPETSKNSRYHLEKIIKNASAYKLAGFLDKADYYIQPEVNILNLKKENLVYQYKLDLFNKKGDKVGSWSDVIRKSVGDSSWW